MSPDIPSISSITRGIILGIDLQVTIRVITTEKSNVSWCVSGIEYGKMLSRGWWGPGKEHGFHCCMGWPHSLLTVCFVIWSLYVIAYYMFVSYSVLCDVCIAIPVLLYWQSIPQAVVFPQLNNLPLVRFLKWFSISLYLFVCLCYIMLRW